MNRLIPVILASSLALSVFANGGGAVKSVRTTKPQTSSASNKGITVNKIAFQTVTNESTLPKAIQEKIQALKTNRGFYLFNNKEYGIKEDGYHLLISLGERSTSGYGIKVKAVEDNEGKTLVYVEETKPGKDTMTAQVITYPYTVIKIKGVTPNIKIVEEKGKAYVDLRTIEKAKDNEGVKKGELFKKLALLQSKIKAEIGTFAGKIDANSIEVKINGKPVALAISPMLITAEDLRDVQPGDEVELIYLVTKQGQNLLIYISETNAAPSEKKNVITAKGIYKGQVDSNSIEVSFDNKVQVLRLEEELKKSFNPGMFKSGSKIEFAYYKNSNGQLILEHIERVD